MAINRNNFLRWSGSMYEAAFVNVAHPVAAAMITGQPYVDVDLLATASSTLGVDPNSVVVVSTDPAATRPPRWNSSTQRLRVFRPGAMPPGALITVQYY